ncbi:MAG: methylated-DNA--[protein]-cysteine S-methyltransferase [Pyrobaculum sp.]
MICTIYGPERLGWDGERVVLNPSECREEVPLIRFVELLPLERVDRRLLYLLGIPRGYVTTYKLYAEALGTSPRQVGRLMASNPYPVVLPCHRVVKSDMSLGGYTGGVEAKRRLLLYEGALCGERPCRVVPPKAVEDVKEAVLKSLGIVIY